MGQDFPIFVGLVRLPFSDRETGLGFQDALTDIPRLGSPTAIEQRGGQKHGLHRIRVILIPDT